MVNDLTAIERSKQIESEYILEPTANPQANKFRRGMTLYKKDTGMAFEVVNVSRANGIKHYNLLCLETGSRYYLSSFALEQGYAGTNTKTEKFGLRMVKRLSKMCAK